MSESEPQKSEVPSMDSLISESLRRFQSQRFTEDDKGVKQAYHSYNAVQDTLKELICDPLDLFGKISKETTVEPNTVLELLPEGNTFDEVLLGMTEIIIMIEMGKKNPEVYAENEARDSEIISERPNLRIIRGADDE